MHYDQVGIADGSRSSPIAFFLANLVSTKRFRSSVNFVYEPTIRHRVSFDLRKANGMQANRPVRNGSVRK